MSGLPLFQLVTDEGAYALRAWPKTPLTIQKIGWWADACERFPKAGYEEDSPIPRPHRWHELVTGLDCWLPTTLVQSADWYWTLSTWVPGVPLSTSPLTNGLRGRLMGFLADLHRLCRTIACTEEPSRGIQERWEALQNDEWRMPTRGVDEADMARYASFVRSVVRDANEWKKFLFAWTQRPVCQHWIVRDLWRENLLISSDFERIWVVDLGASRVEAPFFDLIRLLGSLHVHWSQWREGVQAYIDASEWKLPLSAEELWMLHRVSVAISIRHWSRVLSSESGRSEGKNSAGWERFRELLTIWELAQR